MCLQVISALPKTSDNAYLRNRKGKNNKKGKVYCDRIIGGTHCVELQRSMSFITKSAL